MKKANVAKAATGHLKHPAMAAGFDMAILILGQAFLRASDTLAVIATIPSPWKESGGEGTEPAAPKL
jgi:electron transfer flavoprotein alpha/beta subunit